MKKTLITICAMLVFSMVMSLPAQAVEVPLVAGQDMPVGHVIVEQVDGSLSVEYVLDEVLYEGCETGDFLELMEIHLHVAYQADLIPTNNKGLPKIGHFEYNGNPTLIPLGEIPGTPGDTVYIAAHAVVGTDSEWCDICEEAATEMIDGEEVCIDFVEDDEPAGDSYFEVTINGKTYPTWCVDRDHSMSLNEGPTAYPFCFEDVVTLYSSTCAPDFYPLPEELTSGYGDDGGIENPENLPAVLWILNEWHNNNPAGWNVLDIQQVIWYLMEDDVDLNNANQEAIHAAIPAEIPEPDCCDYVGVIIMPTQPVVIVDEVPVPVPDDELRQLAMMLVPAPCCIDETAWALSGYPDARDGILFAPAGPKGKRSGSWAEYFTFPVVQP